MIKLFTPKAYTTKVDSYAVCQNCGNTWKVKPSKKVGRKITLIQIAMIAVLLILCLVIGSLSQSQEEENSADPNAIYTQAAETVLAGMTQTAASDPNVISTQVAGTIMAEEVGNTAPTENPKQVLFICKECVMDGDNLAITLWELPNNMGSASNKVYDGDTCLLLDRTMVDGVEKVKLQCPGGTGWTRAEAITDISTNIPTNIPTITTQVSFTDGTYQVGTDIQPGTYRTEGGEYCYWERLSGFGGTFDEIIANSNPSGPSIVTILPSDIGFSSTRCDSWVLQSEQIVAAVVPQSSFGDGTWRVGIDIQPGTYQADGGEYCYWERLSGFNGTFNEIIANDNPSGQVIITISPTDKGFTTVRCGTWILQ